MSLNSYSRLKITDISIFLAHVNLDFTIIRMQIRITSEADDLIALSQTLTVQLFPIFQPQNLCTVLQNISDVCILYKSRN
jgi:hypothetical protein